MLMQINDDIFINTDQVNYIKGFTDLVDGKEKTYITFINKDSVCLPITIEEFTNIIKGYISEG